MFMRRVIVACVVVCLACAAPVRAWAEAGGAARTFIINLDYLDQSKAQYQAGDAKTVATVNALIGRANTVMNWGPWSVLDDGLMPPSGDPHDYLSYGSYWWPNPDTPDGLPWIARDGYINPANDGDLRSLGQFSQAAESLGLAYYMTGDERYSTALARDLRTWFLDPATRMNPVQKYGLIIPGISDKSFDTAGFRNTMRTIFDSAGILEMSPNWSASDKTALQQWAHDFATFIDNSDEGQAQFEDPANHGTNFDVNKAILNLYSGDLGKAHEAIQYYLDQRMPGQFAANGEQIFEMGRANNFLYHRYHLGVVFDLAQMATNYFPDLDVWNHVTPDGASLQSAVQFMLPYFTGELEWPYFEPGNEFPRDDDLYYWQVMVVAAVGMHDPDLYRLAEQHRSKIYIYDSRMLTHPASAVPEPATVATTAMALVSLATGYALRRRRLLRRTS
ncbi:MAG: alginate lyase family protein [Pirellulales bacterium]|nr:alginate lyase family protein [Pirellulales bacterium]